MLAWLLQKSMRRNGTKIIPKTATFCAFGVYTVQRDQNTGENMLNLKCETIHDHGGILYE